MSTLLNRPKKVFYLLFLFSLFGALPVPAYAATVWDQWYQVNLTSKVIYGVYHEICTLEGTGLNETYTVSVSHFKSEQGVLKREEISTQFLKNPLLQPVSLFFRNIDPKQESTVEAKTETSGKYPALNVRIKQGLESVSSYQKELKSSPVWTQAFPLLLKNYLSNPEKKIGSLQKFSALLEDQAGERFPETSGTYTWKEPDTFAKSHQASFFEIDFAGNHFKWWVENSGKLIQSVSVNSKIFQITAAQAEKWIASFQKASKSTAK